MVATKNLEEMINDLFVILNELRFFMHDKYDYDFLIFVILQSIYDHFCA